MAVALHANIDTSWIDETPVLDDLQAGSLKRILQLADQLPDDWSGMMGRTTLQEDFTSLRFQLAFMSYALALAHVHRMPAAPGLFKKPFEQLIQKILSPDCWMYWHYVSTGMGPVTRFDRNSSLGKLPAEWNPVVKDNIMYSAYLQSMALLYHYLFRDDRYAQPGALTLAINPFSWGGDEKLRFEYDERSLNDHIYWQMVQTGYLGVACEPNCIFQICNQPPILGFRFNDLVYGGNQAKEVTDGYMRAWSDFGILTEDGRFTMMVQERERVAHAPQNAPWVDFWQGAMMHAWNPDFVKECYPKQMAMWSVDAPDGSRWIKPAVSLVKDYPPLTCDLGWAAVCASELGDTDSLGRLLTFADSHLQPKWQDGALYYKRHDEWFDADGMLSAMDPHTSNALLPYARLNVPGGLKKLYDGPLNDDHFSRPAIVAMSDGVDLRRAWFDTDRNALVITVGKSTNKKPVSLEISNAPGEPLLTVADGIVRSSKVKRLRDGALAVDFRHTGPATLVLTW